MKRMIIFLMLVVLNSKRMGSLLKMKRITASLAAAVLSLSVLAGCSGSSTDSKAENAPAQSTGRAETENVAEDTRFDDTFLAMDTVMTVSAFGPKGEEGIAAAREKIEALDALLSTGSETSEVSRLNAEGGGKLSSDTLALAEESLRLYEETEGAFDISIYPVMKLWGFNRLDELKEDDVDIPTDEELEETLKLVDAGQLTLDAENETLTYGISGMEVDFGGITKGYASDSVINMLREMGVTHAMLNLGGNVQTLGTKPDGSKWRIGIQYPDLGSSDIVGVVSVSDKAVITSGDYERTIPGTEYHHIIDPATGWPVENGLRSVTIVSKDGMLADGLSTSLFVMGMEKATEYWRSHSDTFDVIFLTEDLTLHVTEGLTEEFKPKDGYKMEIIGQKGS